MDSIILILITCVLFIHIGLGDTICDIIGFDFILFRCVKCITFWSILVYCFFVNQWGIVVSLSTSFICAYLSLWLDLLLSKLAVLYEKWGSQDVATKETEHNATR